VERRRPEAETSAFPPPPPEPVGRTVELVTQRQPGARNTLKEILKLSCSQLAGPSIKILGSSPCRSAALHANQVPLKVASSCRCVFLRLHAEAVIAAMSLSRSSRHVPGSGRSNCHRACDDVGQPAPAVEDDDSRARLHDPHREEIGIVLAIGAIVAEYLSGAKVSATSREQPEPAEGRLLFASCCSR
jgi:hypothetical protein